MLRFNKNICFKAFNYQFSALKLQNKTNIHFGNFNALIKYSTNNTDVKPLETEVRGPENVYHGILSRQIRAVKVFSLTSSVVGVTTQPIFYEKAGELGGTPMIFAVCGIVGFFTFVTPLLLHFITKKYVIDIEYDEKTKGYTADTVSFFLYRKRLTFTPDDVEVPDALGMFTSCYIKGKPVFFDLRHFRDPQHYAKIMGYDKPMDFKLGNLNVQPSDETKKNNNK